jgi:hypothetical protein
MFGLGDTKKGFSNFEKAMRDASDMIVRLGWHTPEEEQNTAVESPLEALNLNDSPSFMQTFGHMTPPMTPLMPAMPGRGAGFGRSLSFA